MAKGVIFSPQIGAGHTSGFCCIAPGLGTPPGCHGAAHGPVFVPADWAFGPKPEEEKAVMGEGAALDVEWPEEDGALPEERPQGEGAGALPGMDIPLGLLSATPRSSITFADPHKKRFF